MLNFAISRFGAALLTVTVAVILVYLSIALLPGDALHARFESSGDLSKISVERERLGLNQPLIIQVASNMLRLLQGDLGTSWASGQPVSVIIGRQIVATLELTLWASLIAVVVGIGLGVFGATTPFPSFAKIPNAIILSIPVTLIGTIIAEAYSEFARLMPALSFRQIQQTLLPAMTIGLSLSGGVASVASQSIRNAIDQPFMLTARAKGLSRFRAIRTHALRVGLLPILELTSLQVGFLISGTMITETLFARPGLGRVLVTGILSKDVPVVQSIVIISVVAYTATRFMADLLTALIDPRVRQPTASDAQS